MKQKKSSHLQHPNMEDKSGKAVYASTTKVNSSTNKTREDNVSMPRGVETDYKVGRLDSKKKQTKGSIPGEPT